MTTATMTPLRHPDDDALIAVASGALPRLRRLLVEAHVAQCEACGARLAAASWPGARWLESAHEAKPAADSWLRLAERLDGATPSAEESAGEGASAQPRPDDGLVPAVVWSELDASARRIGWRPLLDSSTQIASLAADKDDALELFLVRTPAGDVLPTHRHVGEESILVLAGSYRDAWGSYRPGDYHLAAAGTSHTPHMGPEADCWALVCVGVGLEFASTE